MPAAPVCTAPSRPLHGQVTPASRFPGPRLPVRITGCGRYQTSPTRRPRQDQDRPSCPWRSWLSTGVTDRCGASRGPGRLIPMTTPTAVPERVRLHSPGELIAALPGLLGFHPHRSLVLICFDTPGRVGLVARVDLPEPGDPAAATEAVERLVVVCANRCTPAVVLVVVDDPAGGRARSPADRAAPRRTLVRRLRSALEEVGTEVLAAHHVGRVEAGQPWGSYRSGAHGRLPDPGASQVSAAEVLHGRVIHGSRPDMARLLDRDPAHSPRDTDDALERAAGRSAGQPASTLLRTVAALLTRSAPGFGLDELAAAGVALGELRVRDAAFAFAATEYADRAQQLWTALVRSMPAGYRAQPAVLLAHSLYCRGEGPPARGCARHGLGGRARAPDGRPHRPGPGHRPAPRGHARGRRLRTDRGSGAGRRAGVWRLGVPRRMSAAQTRAGRSHGRPRT